jgi:hypothetical protein
VADDGEPSSGLTAAEFTSTSTADPAGVPKQGRSKWPLIVAAMVAVAIIVAGVLIVLTRMSAAISTGTGTATISWTSATPSGSSATSGVSFADPPQPFSGDINGTSVSGVSTTLTKNLGSALQGRTVKGSTVQIFQYKGQFGGKPFDIGLFIHLPVSLSSPGGPPPDENVVVKGTYNGEAVNGTIKPPTPGSQSTAADFQGTIGTYKVTGTITSPAGGTGKQTATATFTVTR